MHQKIRSGFSPTLLMIAFNEHLYWHIVNTHHMCEHIFLINACMRYQQTNLHSWKSYVEWFCELFFYQHLTVLLPYFALRKVLMLTVFLNVLLVIQIYQWYTFVLRVTRTHDITIDEFGWGKSNRQPCWTSWLSPDRPFPVAPTHHGIGCQSMWSTASGMNLNWFR